MKIDNQVAKINSIRNVIDITIVIFQIKIHSFQIKIHNPCMRFIVVLAQSIIVRKHDLFIR